MESGVCEFRSALPDPSDGTAVESPTEFLCVRRIEKPGMGSPVEVRRYTYGLDGRLARNGVDFGDDGIVEVAHYFDHATVPSTTLKSTDYGDDGSVEAVEVYEYDDDGHLVRVVTDAGGDGHVDSAEAYEYDDEDRTVAIHEDGDGDGAADGSWYFAYDDFDEDWFDWKTETLRDEEGDGTIDQATYYTPNAAHTWCLYEFDNDYDGVIDYMGELLYPRDDSGRVVSASFDYDGDGVIDRANGYEYDEQGRIVVSTEDEDGDGVIDLRTQDTFAETCTPNGSSR